METICITLPTFGSAVTVNLDRKKMKTCRLKVYPNQKIVLSLPQSAPDAWAESFLMEKSGWIELKLQSFQKTVGYAATKEIRNGYSIRMLGEDMIFALSQCEKECVYAEGKTIRICCKSPENQTHVKQLFEAWWRRQAKEILQERVHVWYPIVEKYGVAMPELSIRKMKTLWGSCSVARQVITFNFYLIKARTPYIDYEVLHELVHFLYQNHSKQFYAFLSNYMPDWKERKLVLDREVVHEL